MPPRCSMMQGNTAAKVGVTRQQPGRQRVQRLLYPLCTPLLTESSQRAPQLAVRAYRFSALLRPHTLVA
jgi:hypothetical protein